ncbi:hypothetical protein L1987_75054 [Smallanthus sonchifolius]|uniref:Uncharacterized protein n=1 Tax=Smallanthus sonchifolius TaxID=185202 RepID=A0ACB9A4G4_9ASTR|nr:hypothetical protein L1987_75054 [Smallanthus sonchifolius]
MTPLAPKYYINYKLMKKKVKLFARQIKAGGLERRYVLIDFSIILITRSEVTLDLCLGQPRLAYQVKAGYDDGR